MQKKMQLKNEPPKIRMQKKCKNNAKKCKSIFIAKIKMQKMQEKCKPICKKNARNLQQFLYLSCNNLGNRNFHFFCILHYETQK